MACIIFFILSSIASLDCIAHAFNRAITNVLATRANGVKYSGSPSLDRIPFLRSSGNEDNSSDHEEMLRELRETKRQIYGADIPMDDEIKQATINAENAFLAAMLEQTQQFNRIKSEQGSDRAVELFMNRIQEEQNPRGEANHTEEKWFVERLQKEQNPGMTTDATDEDWQ
ncbi:hypothetical protein HJC23_010271 [Cyclotella cryptica]|uniref:Uncharacterized protein n=1 Tax=Cyclotella cryptica TaxID=29204 RepID=A0ABD3QNC2_9STRA